MNDVCGPPCWTELDCRVCGRPFSPVGRSVGLEASSGYCDPYEPCDVTQPNTRNRHLWSEHDEVRKIHDPNGWARHLAGCAACRGDDDDEEPTR